MSKKILACGDFSQIPTGYGVYMNGLLSYLHRLGYEIAELACSIDENDPRIKNVPWKIYPNIPGENTKNREVFNKTMGAEYGAWQFEAVCLDFKPTHVLDIRDIWFCEYQLRSPLRKYFSSIIMPAVDAIPQHRQWLETYAKADKIITYTNWAAKVLGDSGYNIKLGGTAAPIAHPAYQMIPDRFGFKNSCGFGDKKIIGMVGRNQKRKLFPKLFEAFRDFLNKTKDNDTYLYIHTAFPDRGWEIDTELLKYGISHRTFLTYTCKKCGNIEPSLFKGTASYCPRCNTAKSAVIANGSVNIPPQMMVKIYNLFDLYVQWHTNEGYGIPICEAAACGVPIVCVGYSAAEEVTELTGGVNIPPAAFYQELETGRMFASPNNEALVEYLIEFFNKPKGLRLKEGFKTLLNYEKNWSKNPYDSWINAIESSSPELSWDSPIRLHNIAPKLQQQVPLDVYVKYLIIDVLGEPELLGTSFEARLVRDLSNGYSPGGFGGVYYHELNAVPSQRVAGFTPEIAYDTMAHMASVRNEYEKARTR